MDGHDSREGRANAADAERTRRNPDRGLGRLVAIAAVAAAVVVIGVLTSGFGLMTPEQAPTVPAADQITQ